MKHTFLSTLALLGLLIAGPRTVQAQAGAAAQQPQPLLVVSISSYDAWMDNVKYLGELHQKPYSILLEGMEGLFTGGEGLAGWDKSKPAGLVFGFGGAMGFVPITDLDKFLKVFAGFQPNIKDVGDGVRELEVAGQQPMYLKPQNGWVWISNSALSLNRLPENPLAALGGLEKTYDLAAKVNLQNLPPLIVQAALASLQQGAEDALQKEPGESEELFQARKASVLAQIENVKGIVQELDQLTAGFKIDRATKKMFVDVEMTFVPGSERAKASPVLRSKFLGFRSSDALASLGSVGLLSDADREQVKSSMGQVRAALNKEINKLDDLKDDAARAQVQQVVGGLIDILESHFDQELSDTGMALLGDGPIDLVAGMNVGDGATATRNLLAGIEMLRDYGVVAAREADVTTMGEVRCETFALTLPDEWARRLNPFFGNNAKLMVASGPKAVYVGMGETTAASLKKLLADSAEASSKPASPMEFNLSVVQLIKATNRGDVDSPAMAAVAKANIAPGSDIIRMEQREIKNGGAFRLEIHEGVLKLIGAAAGSAQFGPPGF